MRLVWTKSNLPLSRLIRWVMKEPVSHFAIVFDERLVFHSNLLGVHLDWFKSFSSHCEVMFSLQRELDLPNEEAVYQGIIDRFDGTPYDFGALFYFGWRGFLWRVFNIPIPKTNKWGAKSAFLCTEMFEVLPERLFPEVKALKDLDMITPYELYQRIGVEKQSN